MNAKRRRSAWSLWMVAALAGCGGGGGGGDTPAPPADAGPDGQRRDARVLTDADPIVDARPPARDAANPEADARAPDSDATAPDLDARVETPDAAGPTGDATAPGDDAAGPAFDATSPADVPDFADVTRPEPWPDPGPVPEVCVAPPPLPVRARPRVEAAEPGAYGPGDAVYDAAGRLVVVTRGGDVYRVAQDGTRTLWAEHVVKTPRGMVFLSTGELVIADSGRGLLVALYPGGEVRTVFSGLDAPMGLEVDARDFLYVAEATRGAIREIDPLTRRNRRIVDAMAQAPAALVFSPDQRTLYVSLASSGDLFAVTRDADGVFGELRPFARLSGGHDPCEGRAPGEPCDVGASCRATAAGALVCIGNGDCLPEEVGQPCGNGGFCQGDGAGGAVCSGDASCEGLNPGDLCAVFGQPGLCLAQPGGDLTCGQAPCLGLVPGSACTDPQGNAGLCADNLRGRLYCQTSDPCDGRIQGAPCRDLRMNVAGVCARAGRAGLYCRPENPCAAELPGTRCATAELGFGGLCDVDPVSGLGWCRAPSENPCVGTFDGNLCVTATGVQGVCFNTTVDWVCMDPNPCASEGAACLSNDGLAGTCRPDAAGRLGCHPAVCMGQPDGDPCVDVDGSGGRCQGGACTPLPVCDALADGAPCHSPRTRGPGVCGPGAGDQRLCLPVNPCAGLALGAECTLRPGQAGVCATGQPGGEPFCERDRGAGVARALETDACGHVYVSDDTAEGIWRITPDGAEITRVAAVLQGPLTSLVWAPENADSPGALMAVGRGGADLIAVPVGVPGRRTVLPLVEPPPPQGPPDARAEACLNLPDAPLAIAPVLQARGYHDVAPDFGGRIVGFDGAALISADHAGNAQLFAGGLQGAEGMDWLPDQSLVVAAPAGLVRVFPNGAQVVIAPDVHAYGVTVGPDGLVYAADNGSTIWRVDPDTLEASIYWTNAQSTSFAPRTIAFDPDRSLMYVGAFGDKVYSMAIDRDLTPLAAPRVLSGVGGPGAFLDGLTVDACGNLYMPKYELSALFRISPDGDARLYHQWDRGQYGHGLEWGRGFGDFPTDTLYFPQPYNGNTVLEMRVGVEGAWN